MNAEKINVENVCLAKSKIDTRLNRALYLKERHTILICRNLFRCNRSQLTTSFGNKRLFIEATAHGIKTIRYIGGRLKQSFPREIKQSRNIKFFKRRIKIGPQINTTAGFAKHLLQT